jgi:hypothetical protein
MSRCVEPARATAEVATDTWSWIGELALHRLVARYYNIKGGPHRVLLLPQSGNEATGVEVDAAGDGVPRGNPAIEIPATRDGGGW